MRPNDAPGAFFPSNDDETDTDAVPTIDPDYLYQRAEQELELAQSATHPAAVKAHYTLTSHYLDGVYGNDAEGVDAA